MGKKLYDVSRMYTVVRVAEVLADDEAEAERLARENEGDLFWKEYDGDYIEEADFDVEEKPDQVGVMEEYHFWLESDYDASFGMIEARNEVEFYRILKEDYKQDIGADGAFDCPITGDEKFLDWRV